MAASACHAWDALPPTVMGPAAMASHSHGPDTVTYEGLVRVRFQGTATGEACTDIKRLCIGVLSAGFYMPM